MPARDPLSVRYDGVVDGLLDRAKRAARNGRGVKAWITSPVTEYRYPDKGGRTAHERAFTRSIYRPVWRPASGAREWSLKLTWGSDAELKPSARGKLARPVMIRLYERGQVRGEQWLGTSRQSMPGDRIDD